MAFYNSEEIRDTLAIMQRGKSIAYFGNVWVTLNQHGEFNVFSGTRHNKHSTTTSLAQAVRHVQISLNA